MVCVDKYKLPYAIGIVEILLGIIEVLLVNFEVEQSDKLVIQLLWQHLHSKNTRHFFVEFSLSRIALTLESNYCIGGRIPFTIKEYSASLLSRLIFSV